MKYFGLIRKIGHPWFLRHHLIKFSSTVKKAICFCIIDDKMIKIFGSNENYDNNSFNYLLLLTTQ